jgi:cytidine deaminase
MSVWDQVQEVASESNCQKRNVGCVIQTEDGSYISHGYNYHENGICDCWEGKSTAIHAEIEAINNIPIYDRYRGDMVAYINHQPCDRCRSILSSICNCIVVEELSLRMPEPEQVEDEPEGLLDIRSRTHGDFKESARFVQAVKAGMEVTPNWRDMDCDQQEALHMIQHKIGRILYGDPIEVDHWTDICGYAKLVEERLNEDS